MSIVVNTVDQSVQSLEKVEQITRECSEVCEAFNKTLDKSGQVAQVIFDASRVIRWKEGQKGSSLSQLTETLTWVPEHPTDLSKTSQTCNKLLNKHYLPFSKEAQGENMVEAEFTFTIEFRDANYTLLHSHVWTLT